MNVRARLALVIQMWGSVMRQKTGQKTRATTDHVHSVFEADLNSPFITIKFLPSLKAGKHLEQCFASGYFALNPRMVHQDYWNET
jgi:hypothetical protein